MNKTSSLLLVAGMLSYSAATHAVTENAIVCEACGYQEARELAIQHASPILSCIPVGSENVGRSQKQSCTSEPTTIVIFDALSRQAYPFELYHSEQGADASGMQVVVVDRTIHAEHLKLLNVGVDMNAELNNSVDDISKALVENFHQITQKTTPADQGLVHLDDASCDGDRDAAALDAAFAPNKNYEVQPKSSYLTVVFKTATELEFFHSKGISGREKYPQLVYAVEQSQKGDKILRINEDYSYMDGLSLASFMKMDGDLLLRVSHCVGAKLKHITPELQFDEPTRNSLGHCVQYGRLDTTIVVSRAATCLN